MKSFFGLIIFALALSQISAAQLKVTVFYETLCKDCNPLFKNQIFPTIQDTSIKNKIYIELVPFGKATFTVNPFNITCQHGPEECLGNVMNACFMNRNGEYYRHVAFVTCCFNDPNPPRAGEKCAKQLGYNYEGVDRCITGNEGIDLQIRHGKRTLEFKPKITFIPTIVYNNVYNEEDQKESLTNFKAVVLRKLKTMGYDME